ncbi:hypothetical protein [Methylobacterium variabile]|nr:hypothetical protein [Methylobacterium variabile]
MTLALLTVLPSRRALVAGAAALLAAPVAKAAAAAPVLALPAPRLRNPLLSAIEDHRSALTTVMQATDDFVRAEEDSAPDEALMLAIADRAADEETAALAALLALTPATIGEATALASHLAETATEFDRLDLFERFAAVLARMA